MLGRSWDAHLTKKPYYNPQKDRPNFQVYLDLEEFRLPSFTKNLHGLE